MWVAIGDRQLHLIGEAEPGRARETIGDYRSEELATGYTGHFAIHVEDLEAFLDGVRSRGGSVVAGPRPRGDGILQAYLTDPDGNVVEIMQTGVAVTGDEPEIGVPQKG